MKKKNEVKPSCNPTVVIIVTALVAVLVSMITVSVINSRKAAADKLERDRIENCESIAVYLGVEKQKAYVSARIDSRGDEKIVCSIHYDSVNWYNEVLELGLGAEDDFSDVMYQILKVISSKSKIDIKAKKEAEEKQAEKGKK